MNSWHWQSFAKDVFGKSQCSGNCVFSEKKSPKTAEQKTSECWCCWFCCFSKRVLTLTHLTATGVTCSHNTQMSIFDNRQIQPSLYQLLLLLMTLKTHLFHRANKSCLTFMSVSQVLWSIVFLNCSVMHCNLGNTMKDCSLRCFRKTLFWKMTSTTHHT